MRFKIVNKKIDKEQKIAFANKLNSSLRSRLGNCTCSYSQKFDLIIINGYSELSEEQKNFVLTILVPNEIKNDKYLEEKDFVTPEGILINEFN